jgi:transcriptional regulator with XRE-family HTH domain
MKDVDLAEPPPDASFADDSLRALGARLRELRRSRGLKLRDLAGAADVSTGLLSQLERGVGNPSYLTLAKLAAALRVPAGWFFGTTTNGDPFLVRRDQRKRLTPASRNATFELITPDLQGKLEVLWIVLDPGASEPNPYQHESETCVVLLDGRVRYHLADTAYDLEPGDSLTFPGMLAHWAENHHDEPATMIVAITPPSF